MMIEAFDEIAHDRQAVEECKIGLLTHKQVHGWHSTKATADAVYALLLRGNDPLISDQQVGRHPGRDRDQARQSRGGHRFLRAAVRPWRNQAGDGPRHRQEERSGHRLG